MKYIIVILNIIFIFGCANNEPTESELDINQPPVSNEIKFIGEVISENSLKPLSGIEVMLEGNSIYFDTTNISGQFNFLSVTEGAYKISFNNSSYAPLKLVITLYSDTSGVFMLSPLVCDYFPLSVGNSWTYDYTEYSHSNSSYNTRWSSGVREYSVISKKTEVETDIYEFLVKSEGIRISKYPECLYCDSLIYLIDTVNFQEEYLLPIKDENGNIWSNFGSFPFSFSRYLFCDSNDTVRVDLYNTSYLYLRREVGIISEFFEEGSNGGTRRWQYNLVDFNITPP